MFELHITGNPYNTNSMLTTVIPPIGATVRMTDHNGRAAEYLITGPPTISIRETDDSGLSTETHVTVPGQLC